MDKDMFVETFADDLNHLRLAADVLEAGLQNNYSSVVAFTMTHEQSAGKKATIAVKARSEFSEHIEETWLASGFIYWNVYWNMSSGHKVRFNFNKENDSPIKLVSVIIGNDKSREFYPWIRKSCEGYKIPVEVEI